MQTYQCLQIGLDSKSKLHFLRMRIRRVRKDLYCFCDRWISRDYMEATTIARDSSTYGTAFIPAAWIRSRIAWQAIEVGNATLLSLSGSTNMAE